MVARADTFECAVDGVWCSKKNEVTRRTDFRGRRFIGKTDRLKADEARVREVLAWHLARHRALPLFGDHEVGVELTWHVPTDRVLVTARDLGPRPKGRTGRRRDVTNLPELLLDAAQGLLYANDNQVAELTVRRALTP